MSSRLISFVLVALAFGTVLSAQSTVTPITAEERLRWLMRQNLAPAVLLEDVAVAAEDTRVNSPKEYGPHWEGFGKRVGLVAGNYGVQSTMEAGLGSIWGEDPRYNRTERQPFGVRIGHVVKMTFLARSRSGNLMPAYARFLAIPGSSFLANTWMPDSQATLNDAVVRTGLGFLGRFGENAFREFRPRK